MQRHCGHSMHYAKILQCCILQEMGSEITLISPRPSHLSYKSWWEGLGPGITFIDLCVVDPSGIYLPGGGGVEDPPPPPPPQHSSFPPPPPPPKFLTIKKFNSVKATARYCVLCTVKSTHLSVFTLMSCFCHGHGLSYKMIL